MNVYNEDIEDIEDNCLKTDREYNDLPNELMVKIMSFLTINERISVRRVCIQWRNAVDQSFRSDTVLNQRTIGSYMMTERALCLVVRNCYNVRHLSLERIRVRRTQSSDDMNGSDTLLTTIKDNCSQLESIDFGQYFSPEFNRKIANYLRRHLKKIRSKLISYKDLNLIIGSKMLESIDISKNTNTMSKSRPEFVRLGQSITELNLIYSNARSDDIIRDVCEGNGRQLKRLVIDISDKTVLSLICQNLIQLKALDMQLNAKDCDLSQIRGLVNLESLRVKNFATIDNLTELMEALEDCHRLTALQLKSNNTVTDINDNCIRILSHNCPHLQSLVISGHRLTDSAIKSLANIKGIQYLSLQKLYKNEEYLSEEAVIGLIADWPQLRELYLFGYHSITKATVSAFIAKAKTSPKEWFKCEIPYISVEKDFICEELPKNLKLISH